MNAQTIILKVNDLLKTLLEEYYDTIVEDVLVTINDVNVKENRAHTLDEMRSIVSVVKQRIMVNEQSDAQIPVKEIDTKTHIIPNESELRTLKRKFLQAYAKIHKIPGRQKNEDLINQLLEKRNKQIAEGKQIEEIHSPQEEQPDIQPPNIPHQKKYALKPKKPTTTIKKKKKEVEIEEFKKETIEDEENDEEFKQEATVEDDEDIQENTAEIDEKETNPEENEEQTIYKSFIFQQPTDEVEEEEDEDVNDCINAIIEKNEWDDNHFTNESDDEEEEDGVLSTEEYEDE